MGQGLSSNGAGSPRPDIINQVKADFMGWKPPLRSNP
jgi:hypothetical protein